MSVEIRPARSEEMPEFARIVSLSLAGPAEKFSTLRPDWTLCAFADGVLATAFGVWPLTMRMNGAALPVAGVTTVSTNPIFRRRGNLRTIMRTDFHRRHEQGEAVAVLYASLGAIYQRYDYAAVTTHHRYAVEPRFLQLSPAIAKGARVGVLREHSPDDLGVLVDVYRRFREPRTGYLHRGAAMWREGVLAPPGPGHRLSVLVYEEEEQPQGYAVYTTGPGEPRGRGPAQQLLVRDLCWLSHGAYLALWDHMARFDLVREITWAVVPPDDPLPHLLLEPRMLNDEARDGIYARIVDLDRAFAGRGYDGEGTVTFAAIDELCPWNAGTWELCVSAGEARVVRSTRTPDFSAPISTLAMLLFGQLSATEAARMGRLEGSDERSLARTDALLRTRFRPFCADHF